MAVTLASGQNYRKIMIADRSLPKNYTFFAINQIFVFFGKGFTFIFMMRNSAFYPLAQCEPLGEIKFVDKKIERVVRPCGTEQLSPNSQPQIFYNKFRVK